MSRLHKSRGVATFWVILAYLASFCGAVAGGLFVSDENPLVIAAVADIVGTVLIFFFSLVFNNSSFYDAYWSVAPPLIGGYWLMRPEASAGDPIRQYVVMALVCLWAIRLTWNWYRGWSGLDHEDWRYVNLRKKTGKAYWLVSFSGIHFFPTVLVYMGCFSIYYGLTGGRAFGFLDIAGIIVTLLGIGFEAVADHQLMLFRKSKPPKEAILSTGLWGWSRHPNYFGEITFWAGLFLLSMGAAPEEWWVVIGPLAMLLLFWFISIPMIDKRMVSRRPNYTKHKKKVSTLFPLPPKS